MARIGSFIGPSEVYSAPLAVVQPADSDFTKSQFHPSLLDPKYKLDDDRMRELQEEILGLLSVLRIARDLPTSP